MSVQYVNYGNGSSTGYYAVAQWAATHTYAAGAIVRQLAAPSVGNERCFRTSAGGISGAVEPTWVLTHAAASPSDGTVTDWTEVTGNATYNWSAPHARLANALATNWAAAGDNIYVAGAHAETQTTAITDTAPGTNASPNNILCVNAAGSVPPVSADLQTTATITASGNVAINLGGSSYIYGMGYTAGAGANNPAINLVFSAGSQVFDNCTFTLNSNGTTQFNFGPGNNAVATGKVLLKNCTLNFGTGASSGITIEAGPIEIVGLTLAGTSPTNLFRTTDAWGSFVHIRDSDLSIMGSGKTICPAFGRAQRVVFERCKLGASVTLSATQTIPGAIVDFINCDSGATNYLNARFSYPGNLTTETVVVVTGGATDGATPFSHKIVTSANSKWAFPFESFPMEEFYAGSTGSAISQTFELMTDNIVLTNADAWIEIEYLGSSSTPLGSIASSGTADVLAAGSNLTTSSATWTTTGLGTPKPQKITVSWTPQLKGVYRAVLKVAKASTTLWLSPPAAKAA